MWNYDEGHVSATLARIGAVYHAAGRDFPDPSDPQSLVRIARISYDCYREGLPWEVAVRKHLQELQTNAPPDGFGLPALTFGRLNGEDTKALHIDGYSFVEHGGGPVPILGVSLFTLRKRFRELPRPQFHAILDEPLSLGFNTAIVFDCFGGPGWEEELHVNDASHYDDLPPFLDTMAERKMRTELVAFAGPYLPPDQQDHWRRVCAVVKDRPLVFLRLMNEINGIDWRSFSRPAGVISSAGSFGGETPPDTPNWGEYDCYEIRRDWPKTLYDAGGGFFELINGYSGYPGTHKLTAHIEPLKWGEPDPWGRGDTDPTHARQWAQQAIGASPFIVFHSHDGIYCRPFHPMTRICAQAFARAARVGFVR